MWTMWKKPGSSKTARINGRALTVEPNETVLQAALRSGIEFPNSCRVGGCATCKCRLVEGKVNELTETGYILTGEELRAGTILACQSVPLTDIAIDVDLSRSRSYETRHGVVVGRELLTHDIAQLTVQLDVAGQGAFDYLPGQYARIAVGAPGEGGEVFRNYSFATPPNAEGRVTFFVRKVPGGAFSPRVVDGDVVGQPVRVEGPLGDFRLHEGDGALLFVAGGSGLAPIVAMLKAAVAAGETRDATLLFGARTQRDLYALEEIAAIGRSWKGRFEFVPVLSHEPEGSGWQGARGLVSEAIAGALSAGGAQAYLCGPPAMIDAATEVLLARGVKAGEIFADRFTTQYDGTRPAPLIAAKPDAAVAEVLNPATEYGVLATFLHYAKFMLFHGLGLFALLAILTGGTFVTWGLLSVVTLYILGDAILGDDTSTPKLEHGHVLTGALWLALPLLVAIVFTALWSVSPGDPLGYGALVQRLTGFDALAARDATGFGGRVSTFILTGLMIGMVGTITAHELTHRTWDKASMLIGRWLLAFSFDTIFAIEHVYGHHIERIRARSRRRDPATAPRGRNVYFHIVASTIKGNVSAWQIESERLRRKGLPVFSWHNAMIRGHLMSMLLVACAFAMGGLQVALWFFACALWGKSLLEIVNYMEHYGMVRDPATPVQPRHSWNSNSRVSSWTMFNLTRHSHHHAQGEVPFQDLRPIPHAPMMVGGYLTTIIVALIPPLWHALMTPKVLAWDRDYASPDELKLAARANARSGIAALQKSGAAPRGQGFATGIEA